MVALKTSRGIHKKRESICDTVDEFITCIPWGEWRIVLVHRREHGGRVYVRFRTWNKHRREGYWYPSKRSFVIPVQHANALASALPAAVMRKKTAKPDWLIAREQAEDESMRRLVESGATEEVIREAEAKLHRYRKGRM